MADNLMAEKVDACDKIYFFYFVVITNKVVEHSFVSSCRAFARLYFMKSLGPPYLQQVLYITTVYKVFLSCCNQHTTVCICSAVILTITQFIHLKNNLHLC